MDEFHALFYFETHPPEIEAVVPGSSKTQEGHMLRILDLVNTDNLKFFHGFCSNFPNLHSVPQVNKSYTYNWAFSNKRWGECIG